MNPIARFRRLRACVRVVLNLAAVAHRVGRPDLLPWEPEYCERQYRAAYAEYLRVSWHGLSGLKGVLRERLYLPGELPRLGPIRWLRLLRRAEELARLVWVQSNVLPNGPGDLTTVRIGVRAFEVPASEAHELVFGEPIPESPR
ncbi:MAG: hypothetical protein C0P77_010590 [Thermoanaerobacterales bacterium]|nr:hypothetical protein [Thermoanaerobacterales bacterium]